MNEKIIKQLTENGKEVSLLVQSFMSELELMPCGEVKFYPKNAFLVSTNTLNSNIFFIKKGCVRSYVQDQDLNDITIWFTFENQIIFSTTSFILQSPSADVIQALEDTEVLVIKKEDLEKVYLSQPEKNLYGRMIMEHYILLLAMRSISLQATFAEFRYHDLLKRHPFILQRVPLRHIASYIGVKTETLSRIRANYKQDKHN
jgi:CRP-like cAMP-binding protein